MASGFGVETERLESRLADIARLRRGYLAHLGESVLALVRTDPELRASREELISAIAACDAERARTEDLLASVEARAFAREQTAVAEPGQAPQDEVPSWVPAVDELKARVDEELSLDDADETAVLPSVEDAGADEDADVVAVPAEGSDDALETDATIRLQPREEAAPDVAAEAKLEELPRVPLTCPACGAPVGEGHKFCMSCGHKLR